MIPVAIKGSTLIHAHRGGGGEASENSMEGFGRVRNLGIRHMETDAHLTKDGLVVINHDSTVDRTFDGKGAIKDLTWNQLKNLHKSNGERMPLLSEVLDAFSDCYFNIDAKSEDVVDPLLDIIDEAHAYDRVMLASFSYASLRTIRCVKRGVVATSLGIPEIVGLYGAAQTATSARSWKVPGPTQGVWAAQVPEYYGKLHLVDRRFVATAHDAGVAVHVWTVNDVPTMERLIDLNVDAIITDYPELLRGILIERGRFVELPPAS